MDWDDFYPDTDDDYNEFIPPTDDDLPDPFLLGRVDLLPSGELFADIYADTPTGDYDRREISLAGIEELLGLDEGQDQGWADMAEPLPFGFDADDPDIRGPFPDEESVNEFINETGMYWADIYYDPITNEYFIDVSY